MSIEKCSVIKYPESWGFKREPIRPIHLREPNPWTKVPFDEMYDWDNLWHDAIQLASNLIVLVGPPLYKDRSFIEQNCTFVTNQNEILKAQCVDLDRVGYTILRVPGWRSSIRLSPGNVTIPVSQHDFTFTNQHTIVTCQKDEPIEWIQQWIAYHRDVHNIKHFLIYNNNCTIYTLDELDKSLQNLGVVVKLVEWNVPHGPFGVETPHGQIWDSDYVYTVALEHAKSRFLAYAKSVLNLFIDELLILRKGNLNSIVNQINQENLVGFQFKGPWIEPYDTTNEESASNVKPNKRKFRSYYCTDASNTIPQVGKYIIIPSKAFQVQWHPHEVSGPMRFNEDIYYGHFMAINTGWNWKRDEYKNNPDNLKPDLLLQHNLNKVKWPN